MLHFYNIKKSPIFLYFFHLIWFLLYITFKKLKLHNEANQINLVFNISDFFINWMQGGKLPGADARKVPYDPKERVKRNLEQGKGFRINNVLSGKKVVVILNLPVQMNYGEHH